MNSPADKQSNTVSKVLSTIRTKLMSSDKETPGWSQFLWSIIGLKGPLVNRLHQLGEKSPLFGAIVFDKANRWFVLFLRTNVSGQSYQSFSPSRYNTDNFFIIFGPWYYFQIFLSEFLKFWILMEFCLIYTILYRKSSWTFRIRSRT